MTDGGLFLGGRQDGSGHRRLARDRPDDRAGLRRGRRARGDLFPQGRRVSGGRRPSCPPSDTAWRSPPTCRPSTGADGLAAAVRERYPSLDVLVNNAGATWGAPLEAYPESAFDKLWAVNVKAVFRLTDRAAAGAARRRQRRRPGPRHQRSGPSTGSGCRPWRRTPTATTKAAVHMLTRQLARQLAPEQITVNAIAPGPFESKMMAFALDDPSTRAAIEQQIPLGPHRPAGRHGRHGAIPGVARWRVPHRHHHSGRRRLHRLTAPGPGDACVAPPDLPRLCAHRPGCGRAAGLGSRMCDGRRPRAGSRRIRRPSWRYQRPASRRLTAASTSRCSVSRPRGTTT